MEKNNIDEKMKNVASIPANYVSILQLQERWLKEKERKQKEKDFIERGVKQDDEQVKAMETRVKLEDKGFLMHFGVNHWKKEPNCGEVSEIVSKKDEDGVNPREENKKWSKNQGGSLEKVNYESQAYLSRENNPVKGGEVRRDFISKRENTAKNSISVESQFQDLWIKKRVEEEGREVKEPARLKSGQVYERNHRHVWSSTRVIRARGTMEWVKKGKKDGTAGGNGV